MLLLFSNCLSYAVSDFKIGEQVKVLGTDSYPAFFHVPGHKAKPFIAQGLVGTISKVYLPGDRAAGGSDHLDRSDERDIVISFTEPKAWKAHFMASELALADAEEVPVPDVVEMLARNVDYCEGDSSSPCDRVEDFMTPAADALVLSAGMPMREAAAALNAAGITGAPVVSNDGKLLGVLTAFDFLYKEVAEERGAATMLAELDSGKWQQSVKKSLAGTVEGAMSIPTAIAPGFEMSSVAALMLSKRFNHVPVVESDGKLVGILTSQDVLRHVLTRLS